MADRIGMRVNQQVIARPGRGVDRIRIDSAQAERQKQKAAQQALKQAQVTANAEARKVAREAERRKQEEAKARRAEQSRQDKLQLQSQSTQVKLSKGAPKKTLDSILAGIEGLGIDLGGVAGTVSDAIFGKPAKSSLPINTSGDSVSSGTDKPPSKIKKLLPVIIGASLLGAWWIWRKYRKKK